MVTPNLANTHRTTIGLFGGTFDPVHNGHLRMALELKQHLQLDQMRLIPCHIPPHREVPVASAQQRAAMVELALQGYPELSIDLLELNNDAPSYSVSTLRQLRRELGQDVSLCLAMGMDSLASLPGWYQWRELLTLAHIIVAARPGWELPQAGDMADYIQQHRGTAAHLRQAAQGSIVIEELSLLPISSTAIREQLALGESPQNQLPAEVLQYIRQQQLYSDIHNDIHNNSVTGQLP